MGEAGIVFALLALILSFWPGLGLWALVPAVLGIVCGVVGLARFDKAGEGTRALPLVGLVFSCIVLLWGVVIVSLGGGEKEPPGGMPDVFQRRLEEPAEPMRRPPGDTPVDTAV